MVLSTFLSSPLDWFAKASTILTAAMFRICVLNQVYTVLFMLAGAKAVLPWGGTSGGKGCAPLGRGLQGQMLPSLGEEPVGAKATLSRGGADGDKGCTPSGRGRAGAKAVLSRGGAGRGKGCLYLEEAKLPVRVMFIISFI